MHCDRKIWGVLGGGVAIAICLSSSAIAATQPIALESPEWIERDRAPLSPTPESFSQTDPETGELPLASIAPIRPVRELEWKLSGEGLPLQFPHESIEEEVEKATDRTEKTLDIAQATSPQDFQPPFDLLPAPPEPPAEPSLSAPDVPLPPEPPKLPAESSPDPAMPEDSTPGRCSGTLVVERFRFEGSTVFNQEALADETDRFLNQPLACSTLVEAGNAVAALYEKNGYETSSARVLIPDATKQAGRGVVIIQAVEGGLEKIEVDVKGRLNPGYVRSRLQLATTTPLNIKRLEQGLQLLQLDPLIDTVSARLSEGAAPGTTILDVAVKTAKTFDPQLSIDNSRVPSVGSIQRRVVLREANLLGLGDSIGLTYSNSDGSDRFDVEYAVPLNSRNGTLRFSYGKTTSRVIEAPFNALDVRSASLYSELSFRQPLIRRIRKDPFEFQEFALGLTVSRRESESFLLGIPFPLSLGADDDGRSRVTAIRFSQEWTRQTAKEVFALRSQFSLGTGLFGATINQQIPGLTVTVPDSRFFSWQGQAQWVRILAPDTVFLARTNVQLADRPLLSLEQFAVGGFGSVRGYRQDTVIADNGAFASVEFWLPILKSRKSQTLIQLIPFVDVGTGWNSGGNPDPETNTLASVGLGLQWRQSNKLTARLEWGIPLMTLESRNQTLQEQGLYFSLQFNPF